jgi:IstB-like ATP binding protein
MARLSSIKTLAGFDFSFQLSLDKNRIMALAALEFIDRSEVVQFLGPPGTGKSHLSLALGVQAIKAGRSVYFTPLSDLVSSLAKAEREGPFATKSGSYAASRSLSSTESATCPSLPVAAICSSSSSMHDTSVLRALGCIRHNPAWQIAVVLFAAGRKRSQICTGQKSSRSGIHDLGSRETDAIGSFPPAENQTS